MTTRELQELLERGYETRGIEFKGTRPRSDKLFFARVVRAVLGMSNRRDGGVIVLGVKEKDKRLEPVGLADDAFKSWNYDDISAGIAPYADPYVEFQLEDLMLDGKRFAIITVAEFLEIPTICQRDYQGVLRAGACYVRGTNKPETSEIPSSSEMRELLSLATEKGVRRFIQQAHAVGLGLASGETVDDAHRRAFDEQLGDL